MCRVAGQQAAAVNAWCRSVYASYSDLFCLVNADGTASNNYADTSWAVAPGFWI